MDDKVKIELKRHDGKTIPVERGSTVIIENIKGDRYYMTAIEKTDRYFLWDKDTWDGLSIVRYCEIEVVYLDL